MRGHRRIRCSCALFKNNPAVGVDLQLIMVEYHLACLILQQVIFIHQFHHIIIMVVLRHHPIAKNLGSSKNNAVMNPGNSNIRVVLKVGLINNQAMMDHRHQIIMVVRIIIIYNNTNNMAVRHHPIMEETIIVEVEAEEEEEGGSNNNSNNSLIPEEEEDMEVIYTHHNSMVNNSNIRISINTNSSVVHQIRVDSHGQETRVVVAGKDREKTSVIHDKTIGAADGNLIRRSFALQPQYTGTIFMQFTLLLGVITTVLLPKFEVPKKQNEINYTNPPRSLEYAFFPYDCYGVSVVHCYSPLDVSFFSSLVLVL